MAPATHTLQRGTSPLLVSFPHAGTVIPPELEARMTPEALQRADVDWHLPQLYAFAEGLGASLLIARHARHVIDLNRPPEDTSLYPGQDVTGLLPIDTFRKEPLYRAGQAPRPGEAKQRLATYWQPYHDALRGELERLHAEHGRVVLWDAHSIASVMPRFFDGKLPDLNLGTADGRACAPAIQAAVEAEMRARTGYTHVSNGRFKGGYITRHYGQPERGIHALQLEMCQCVYMDETAPFAYRPDLAAGVQPLLQRMLQAALEARA
ncbi:MAG: N-formylglutamate deformylase [Proteobacteria bacterium]|nr:N-formylglutamate deformylase [Pseudomonadota bacterium]